MTAPRASRPYRKKKRADQERKTRRRITEAAVELHRTVGPANTGIKDVAQRAGVSRTTVYSHFPTDTDLFVACSSHWAAQNPFPAPAAWAEIGAPGERLSVALTELYRWYGRKQDMLGKVLRDAALVPALDGVMGDLWRPYLQEIVDTLAVGWSPERRKGRELAAALRLAVDFATWRLLTAGAGLDDRSAADLAARMVTAAVPPRRGATGCKDP